VLGEGAHLEQIERIGVRPELIEKVLTGFVHLKFGRLQ